MSFKPGDRVELKSGGPEMTISSSKDGMFFCMWFNRHEGNWELKSHTFRPDVLKSKE